MAWLIGETSLLPTKGGEYINKIVEEICLSVIFQLIDMD